MASSSSSSSLKNDELRDTVTDSFKSQSEQKCSSMSMIKPGKTVEPIRMTKIVIIILLLISCSEPVAAMARSLNKMSPPPALLAEDARGPVPPFGRRDVHDSGAQWEENVKRTGEWDRERLVLRFCSTDFSRL